jgi:hypothetical protein
MRLLTFNFCFVNRHMADQSPDPNRVYRKTTRLKDLAVRRGKGQRTYVDIDVRTGIATGDNGPIFRSYLGFLIREHISILTPTWDDVVMTQRNMLWQDLVVRWFPDNYLLLILVYYLLYYKLITILFC